MSIHSSQQTVQFVASQSRSRSRSPRSPAGPPPPSLLRQKANTMTFQLTINADIKGSMQSVVKQLGAEIITKAAWLDFKTTAIDQHNGLQQDATHGEFIGGNIVKKEQNEQSEAFCTDTVQINFDTVDPLPSNTPSASNQTQCFCRKERFADHQLVKAVTKCCNNAHCVEKTFAICHECHHDELENFKQSVRPPHTTSCFRKWLFHQLNCS